MSPNNSQHFLICDLIFRAAREHNWGETKLPERIHIPRALIEKILMQDRQKAKVNSKQE